MIGLGIAIALAVAGVIIGIPVYEAGRDPMTLFHIGIDMFGTFICIVLFYGCMAQVEESTRSFKLLVIMNSLSFVINEVMWIVQGTSEWRLLYFGCCIVSKVLNLAMIYYFFIYVRDTLHFEGALERWADRAFSILLIVSVLIVLTNVFYPLSFSVDPDGHYYRTGFPWLEDIYLIIVSVATTALIIKCTAARRQKWAAMSFILIPIMQFIATGGAFAYATQYASVLLSLILMYCIIFNDRSSKLAATQTELNMASQIQEAMLPSIFPAFPSRTEFDVYARMDPAKEVGGDFYDFFLIDEDHLGLIIADVAGKGVPAALFMMISKTIIQNYAKLGLSVAEIMKKTNEALCTDNSTGMFVTAWAGILEISSGTLVCANAGHEYPAVNTDDKFILLKDRHGFVLGGMAGSKYSEYTISLKKGDMIFVYTDGIPEATNAEQSMFGTDRMINVLNKSSAETPKGLINAVKRAVDKFMNGSDQFDDLTMLCLLYNGK